MKTINQQFCLAARPNGLPKDTDWHYTETQILPLKDGEFLVEVHFISLDPAMRAWMNEARSYMPPVEIGEVMRALGVGEVIESKNADFSPGDYVSGLFGVQKYAVSTGKHVTKVDDKLAPLSVYLGALGMTGLTAYFGLLDIAKPKAGETLLVSGAAGAVGTIVGQIGKIQGCRVVGIAGSDEKCRYIVDELNFDAAINYHQENVSMGIRKHCPKGIDIYFDNVGGDILDDALNLLARYARVVICGAISQYNNAKIRGPANYLSLLVNHASMTGFVVTDYLPQYQQAFQQLAGWYKAKKLKSREEIISNFETFPHTFLKLFKGENIGKLILKVA